MERGLLRDPRRRGHMKANEKTAGARGGGGRAQRASSGRGRAKPCPSRSRFAWPGAKDPRPCKTPPPPRALGFFHCPGA